MFFVTREQNHTNVRWLPQSRGIETEQSFQEQILPGGQDKATAIRQFQSSLGELVDAAVESEVPLLVEATNRYEATLANSLDDAWELAAPFEGKNVYILPDTFHMNIEEAFDSDIRRSAELLRPLISNE